MSDGSDARGRELVGDGGELLSVPTDPIVDLSQFFDNDLMTLLDSLYFNHSATSSDRRLPGVVQKLRNNNILTLAQLGNEFKLHPLDCGEELMSEPWSLDRAAAKQCHDAAVAAANSVASPAFMLPVSPAPEPHNIVKCLEPFGKMIDETMKSFPRFSANGQTRCNPGRLDEHYQ